MIGTIQHHFTSMYNVSKHYGGRSLVAIHGLVSDLPTCYWRGSHNKPNDSGMSESFGVNFVINHFSFLWWRRSPQSVCNMLPSFRSTSRTSSCKCAAYFMNRRLINPLRLPAILKALSKQHSFEHSSSYLGDEQETDYEQHPLPRMEGHWSLMRGQDGSCYLANSRTQPLGKRKSQSKHAVLSIDHYLNRSC